MSKNTLALIYTAILTFSFFFAGLFGVLDYFIVKALLFIGFGVIVVYIIILLQKQSAENKNHLK